MIAPAGYVVVPYEYVATPVAQYANHMQGAWFADFTDYGSSTTAQTTASSSTAPQIELRTGQRRRQRQRERRRQARAAAKDEAGGEAAEDEAEMAPVHLAAVPYQ